jgi:bifunctional non-homologous end joining protein LigD
LQHHRSKAEALLFYAFDILIYRGSSLLDIPLHGKREVLQKIFAGGISAPLMLPVNLEASPTDLVRALREFGFEGVVAKRKDSLYESGKRSGAWLKCKINQRQEFVIGGYVPDHPL